MERPILFNERALHEVLVGRKTQTRRPIVKAFDAVGVWPNAEAWAGAVLPAAESGWIAWWPGTEHGLAEFTKRIYRQGFPCPYGAIGDRLWVREAWTPFTFPGSGQKAVIHRSGCGADVVAKTKWRPSIHMPRAAARTFLEITNVRVQRLQEITVREARAEGFASIGEFNSAWDDIYRKRGWGWPTNPWSWVVSFRMIEFGELEETP